MSGDDQEFVMLKHILPSSSRVVRARLEPVAHSKPSLKAKSRSTTTTGADKLPDKSCKSKPNYAVAIPSSFIPVGKDAPRSDASQSQEPTPAGTPVPKYNERLEEITNDEAPQPLATHTPQPVPIVHLTRSTESIPEYASRREDLTARDIDALLGAVPVPFDFSLSHHRHSATRDDGDTDGSDEETSSLWWHSPIFEARAKADIRRTLDALLPADPAQDPPLTGSGDFEVVSRQRGARMWAERLEDAFGPGPLDRGKGLKPPRVTADDDVSILSEPQVPEAQQPQHAFSKRPSCTPPVNVRPRPGVPSASAGSASQTATRSLKRKVSRRLDVRALSTPGSKRVRIDRNEDGEGDPFGSDDKEFMEAATAARPSADAWERGGAEPQQDCASTSSAEDGARILNRICTLEEKARGMVGEISALKTYFSQ